MFCLYLIQHTAASKTRTFCVCPWHTHLIPTTILSYSFSHSVELPLGFTGVVLYLHFLHKTVTFTHFRYSSCWQYVLLYKSNACTLFRCFHRDAHLLLSVRRCAYADQVCAFHFSPKVCSTTLTKLPVPKNHLLLHSSFLRILPSCWTRLIAYEGSCWCEFGEQSVILVQFWIDFEVPGFGVRISH